MAVQALIIANLFVIIHYHFMLRGGEVGLPPYGEVARLLLMGGYELFNHIGFRLTIVVLIWVCASLWHVDWIEFAGGSGRT